MKINYIEHNGVKLFSFYAHDFKQFEPGVFIDGGFEYTRTGNAEFKSGEITDLIEDIREYRVYPYEEFPLKKWSNKLVKLYFRYLVKRTNMNADLIGLFHIIGAEILYRQKHGKTKKASKTTALYNNSETVS